MWRIFVLGSNLSRMSSGVPSRVRLFKVSSSFARLKGRCPSAGVGRERVILSISSCEGSKIDPENIRFWSMGARHNGPEKW